MRAPTSLVYRLGKGPLPRPPIVSQLNAVLPDGSTDPQAASDCGEACCASVLNGLMGSHFSPGAIRQAIGPAVNGGYSTASELADFLARFLPGVEAVDLAPLYVWRTLHKLRRSGMWALHLGYWVDPNALHWRLQFEGDAKIVWGMDPYLASYEGAGRSDVALRGTGTLVLLGKR